MRTTTSPSLVGRADDLQALRNAYTEAVAGSAGTVLVGGEAGIGKTRLVAEFLDALPSDTIVVRGQSIDQDAPPYAPIVAALRSLAEQIGSEALLSATGPSTSVVSVLVPELDPEGPRDEAARPGGTERLYDAVAGTLENVAREHPLILVVEDLHWADTATLGLLRFLVRVIEHSRILFVLTFRSDEIGRGSVMRAWLPELDRNRRVTRRELARLDRRQVREMAELIMEDVPDDGDILQVFQRTDGVPFLVEELICCSGVVAFDSFPDTLRDILLARYETLSEPSQRILRLIAAGGVRLEHELLMAVCTENPDVVDAAAREAVAASVLVVDGTAYAFRHALVREAIHEQLLPGERVRFHSAYAEALEAGRGSGSPDATAISYHWMAAHNVQRAFSASIAAMLQARGTYANASAARMGERALELWDQVPDAAELAGRTRVELLAETSYILRNAGESERAVALIDAAIAEADPHDVDAYAKMLRDKASYLANIGQLGSIELLQQALQVIEGRPQSVLRANILGELAARMMLAARFSEAVDLADAAFAEATAVDSPARTSVAANIRGFSKLSGGRIDEGLADLALARQLAADNDSARLRYWVNQSDALNLLGRYDEAVRTAEEGAERARLRGVERTTGVMLISNVIGPLYALGRTARADELLDRALELDSPIGFAAHLQRLKVQATLWSGRIDEADRLLRGWRAAMAQQQRVDAQSQLGLAAIAADLALAKGDVLLGWKEASIVIDPAHRSFPAYDLPVIARAARALARARSTGLALDDSEPTDYDELERRLRAALAADAFWPTADAYAALLEAELGGPRHTGTDPALWVLASAATQVSTSPVHLHPYAAYRAAEAYANAADREAAREWSQTASIAAEAIGLHLIVERVQELERRVGAIKVRHDDGAITMDATALDALLTERELQVIELIARGRSNRQIADELYISAKTASVHVSNILRKTGAATRTEAAYLARELAS